MSSFIKFPIKYQYEKSNDYIQSPFRYPGGKFYALKYIIPFLNAVPHSEFREPFVGGGSVFFGKKKAEINWINDIESKLITTYKAIQSEELHLRLINELTKEEATKDRHKFYKEFVTYDDFDIAKKIYYLNRTSYCGIINKPAWGYALGKSSPPKNWGEFLSNAHKKLNNVKITNSDFSEIIKAPADRGSVLLYLDPPYYKADTKRAYIHPFDASEHYRLAKMLSETEHYFCLSYDDCDEIRALYNWANIYERSWFYNTANTKKSRIVGNELIITNYSVHQLNSIS